MCGLIAPLQFETETCGTLSLSALAFKCPLIEIRWVIEPLFILFAQINFLSY